MAYFLMAKVGLRLAIINESASAFWPPTGLALAALLLWGRRMAPGIFLGAFAANFTINHSGFISSGIAFGNTFEAVAGSWLVTRFAEGKRTFERPGTVLRFILLAAVGSTLLSGTLGVLSLYVGGLAPLEKCWEIWLTWWVGDMVSAIIFAPFLVVWGSKPSFGPTRIGTLEAGAVMLATAGVALFVFAGWTAAAKGYPLEYLTLIPLCWAALRFAQRGAVTVVLLLSITALAGTSRGFGPFGNRPPNEALVLLQLFMATIGMAGLVLAAITGERNRMLQRLQIQDAVSRFLVESPSLAEASAKILRTLVEVTS
ncbi:MAG TPA: MASE1 domain-containing protein, partial [Verrucomicrobiae bacterium]|nr:MASE1 domain-containing protein [Verrucomicrobiae bacterium]